MLPFRVSLAQTDLENVLKQYDEATVSGYTQPLADLVGANMNAGLLSHRYIPPTGLRLALKFVGMGAVVGDDQKSFTLTLPSSFSQRTMEAPRSSAERVPSCAIRRSASNTGPRMASSMRACFPLSFRS